MSEFDYYSSIPSSSDLAKWLVFLRAYAYVRTPACIYSNIKTPSSARVYRKIASVPIPDYVTNVLSTEIELFWQARTQTRTLAQDKTQDRASHSNLAARDSDPLSDLSVFRRADSSFKPRDVDPYSVSRATVLCLGDGLVARAAGQVGCDPHRLAIAIASAYNGLARRASPMPAPLRPDEWRWASRLVTGPVWVPEMGD